MLNTFNEVCQNNSVVFPTNQPAHIMAFNQPTELNFKVEERFVHITLKYEEKSKSHKIVIFDERQLDKVIGVILANYKPLLTIYKQKDWDTKLKVLENLMDAIHNINFQL
jgi:hypothetical protein